MTENDLGPEQFLKEKNLFQIYKASWRISINDFNLRCVVAVVVLAVTDLYFSNISVSERAAFVRVLADSGLTASIGLLGFLIAGFAIFSGITSPELSLFMAAKRNNESGLSYLKHNYFNFVNVFIYYLAFCGFCFVIYVFGGKHGLIVSLINYSARPDQLKAFVVGISYIAVIAGYAYMLLLLKSFVFNIYHSVMTALRYEYQMQQIRKQNACRQDENS